MQDRFKFRVWNEEDNLMCSVSEINFLNEFIAYDYKFNGISMTTSTSLKNIPLMQCTGLKDKNDKLIFEGDIVKKIDSNALGYYRERICEVSWDDKFLYYIIMTTLGDGYALSDYDSSQYEIIGNIYENPELLEAKD